MPVLHAFTRLGVPLLAAAALHAVPIVTAASAATASAAAASDEPGWTAEPVSGRAGAAARPYSTRPYYTRPYYYMAGTPGTVLEDRLALANTTDQEHTVTLRGADAYNTPDGAFAVRPATPPDTPPAPATPAAAGAGSWISFGGGATVTIPPRTRAVVPFTVTVPPASPPGDHPAAVVATEAGREVGVRVHLRVSGPTLAALTVEDVAVRGEGAGRVVAYTLVNRGNVALAPELAIRAKGRFGEVPGRGARALPVELLPGQRVELTEPWPGAPVFDKVDLILTVTAPGGARATAGASVWCVPWGIAGATGAGLAALGATTGAALLLVRTRRTRREPPTDQNQAPVSAQAQASEHELTGAAR
ncbi:hypothetical protein MTF65_16525 [Streptomyces sp. APSN-46.1]|uniref:COG1470 family protein n=1 Tax=Streptomyces sp. APSN-46.1 TaxID=2929049 RepID=UPI001FB4561A|nr:hypothetical protein [Streptomyces sp. APSN-46.1]MCJ1678913.1 hypothetical protein [Streptomyces sp. APSN-46.1]